jgi:hypothetical protein
MHALIRNISVRYFGFRTLEFEKCHAYLSFNNCWELASFILYYFVSKFRSAPARF